MCAICKERGVRRAYSLRSVKSRPLPKAAGWFGVRLKSWSDNLSGGQRDPHNRQEKKHAQ